MWLLQVDPEDSHLTRVTEVFREHWETLEGESPHARVHVRPRLTSERGLRLSFQRR